MINNYKYILASVFGLSLLVGACTSCKQDAAEEQAGFELKDRNNPLFRDVFTADPAAFVHDGTVYLYTGHDEQVEGGEGFVLNEWLLFSTTDMDNWEAHGPVLKTTDFDWANGQAWAAHVESKNDKFYYYVTVEHGTVPGKAIGVAVADHPTGPFEDAIGQALITNDMTTHVDSFWDDIDPAVFIDDDGSPYLYWGNSICMYAKLKDNMIELDGPIQTIDLPEFTEAPWVIKRNDFYYLIYSAGFPERIDYAMATSPEGPWEFKGNINPVLPNSPTHHVGAVEFKDLWYLFYHTGQLPTGGEFRRSVGVDYLNFNEDGTIQPVVLTDGGVDPVLE